MRGTDEDTQLRELKGEHEWKRTNQLPTTNSIDQVDTNNGHTGVHNVGDDCNDEAVVDTCLLEESGTVVEDEASGRAIQNPVNRRACVMETYLIPVSCCQACIAIPVQVRRPFLLGVFLKTSRYEVPPSLRSESRANWISMASASTSGESAGKLINLPRE